MAGLVVVTPACGFITASGAIIIGVLAGLISFFAVVKLKAKIGYDDALDTFGVHAVGGTLGALVTGFLAMTGANPNLALNLKDVVGHTFWLHQWAALGITLVMAVVGTVVITYIVKAVVGLRPDTEDEVQGVATANHGEEGYILEEKS